MAADERLRPYASDRQWEIYLAVCDSSSKEEAAKKLGINRSNVTRAIAAMMATAAKRGYSPDHDMVQEVPPGFRLKGTSTLYDADGNQKLQWVKSTIDHERQMEIFREAIEAMAEDIPRQPLVPPPETSADHLLACYPVGDHHFGMLSWGEETGEDYDLSIGARLLTGAMDHLVKAAPSCSRAAIVLLGDFMHYDSFKSVTPTSGHLLDADSRFPKMVRAAIKAVRYMIRAALEHHKEVLVIVEIGNHDPSSSIFLMECLHNVYENEPRVTIDRHPGKFHYFRFGKNLVGVTHGDGVKLDKLPLIMATDRAKDWGETEYRYWWTGHVHHDQVKDFNGCRTESMRILPPADAYAANAGYRSGRDMKAIILHRDYGEVARHIVNPAMLESAA